MLDVTRCSGFLLRIAPVKMCSRNRDIRAGLGPPAAKWARRPLRGTKPFSPCEAHKGEMKRGSGPSSTRTRPRPLQEGFIFIERGAARRHEELFSARLRAFLAHHASAPPEILPAGRAISVLAGYQRLLMRHDPCRMPIASSQPSDF